MSNAFEQWMNLARANARLALGMGEVARESGAAYMEAGRQAFHTLSGELQDLKVGSVPGFNANAISDVYANLEKKNEASAMKARAALEQWQTSCQDTLSQSLDAKTVFAPLKAWPGMAPSANPTS